MRKDVLKDTRLLESLEHIDDEYISSAARYKMKKEQNSARSVGGKLRSLKYVLALAACLLLMSAVVPVVSYLIERFPAGVGEHIDPYSLSQAELDAINEAWGDSRFAESPEEVGYLEGERFIYGKYDGAIVLGRGRSMLNVYGEESVAGCIFQYPNGDGIRVYYDGEIFGLDEAYENGFLTAGQIKEIWRNHQIHVLNTDQDFEDDYIYGDYLDPIDGLEPLTKTRVAEINAAWDALYPDFDGALIDPDKLNKGMNYRYLGTIGGRVIIWRSEGEGVAVTKNLRGYEFSHSSSFDIIVCYCDTFYFIEEASEKWMLMIDQIELIHSRNEEYEKYYAVHNDKIEEPYLGELKIVDPTFSSPFKLSYEEQYEIIWNYIKDDDSKTKLRYSYSVRCFMKSDGAYAVMLDSGRWGYFQAVRHVDVAGYKFLFPDSQRMYIYKDGVFYTLLDAYEFGVVNEEYIASIIWNKAK